MSPNRASPAEPEPAGGSHLQLQGGAVGRDGVWWGRRHQNQGKGEAEHQECPEKDGDER